VAAMTQFASVPDGRLAYDVAGAGDPPMLFVHGWCCDRSCFAPQVTHFSASHAVVAVDLRGHGESSAPEQPLKPGRISAALQAQRLTLGGHGLGDLLVSNGPSGGLPHARCSQPMAGRDNRNQAQARSGVRLPIAAAASSRAQRIRVTAVSG
jgi:pimeloyl-ACP methyl ester carboxylesterase